jgi:hypothetical protein
LVCFTEGFVGTTPTAGRLGCETFGGDSDGTRGRLWDEADVTLGRLWCDTRGVDSEVTRGRPCADAPGALAAGMPPAVLVRGIEPVLVRGGALPAAGIEPPVLVRGIAPVLVRGGTVGTRPCPSPFGGAGF